MTPEAIIEALEKRSEVLCQQDAILMRRAAIALRVATAKRHQGAENGNESGETS